MNLFTPKRKFLSVLSILLLFILRAQAQTNTDLYIDIAKSEFQAKQVIPPSPTAASLGQYGNVPVSLFTGTPNISIPLYELKGNILSLPITLTYNASGFKAGDLANWTGSGWSLDAGGVISRSVLGNPDNQSNYFNSTNPAPPNSSAIVDYYTYIKNLQSGVYENQPDVYYYNFAGHTGKFVLRPDQSVVKKKRDMMKITANNIQLTGGGSFTIVDDHGIIYTFSDVENSLTIPNDVPGGGMPYNYPSAWFLTKIQSADNEEEIDFNYYTTTNSQQIYANPQQNQSYTYQHFTQSYTCTPGGSPTWGESENSYTQVPPSNSIQRKYINNITLKRGGVTIAYVNLSSSQTRQDSPDFPEDRKLDSVSIYNSMPATPLLVKKYKLTYSYFINNSNVNNKKRLRLDAVQQVSVDGLTTSPPAYQFTYNTTYSIPDRYTAALDHWGFYNGADANTSLVPTMQFHDPANPSNIINLGGNANREPGLDATLCTMLIKMQYPTGGYTTFDYELNQSADNGVTRNVGGLRIKTITDYSVSGVKATTKNYSYTDDSGNPSGSVVNFPQYFKQSSLYEYSQNGSGCAGIDKQSVIYTISANSVIGLGSIQGTHIGYAEVIETPVDNSTGQPLGKTVYKYNIGSNTEYDDDIAAGELLRQEKYRVDGKLLESITNTYSDSIVDNVEGFPAKSADLQTNKPNYCLESNGNYANWGFWETGPTNCVSTVIAPTKFFLDSYNFRSWDDKILSKADTSYDPDNNIYRTFVSNYSYDNPAHIYPTRITQSSINNTQVVTFKKYAADFTYTGSSSDPAAAGIKELNYINMPGTEIETVQYRQNADGTNKRYINGRITKFSPATIPTPDSILSVQTVKPLTSLTYSAINGSGIFTYNANYKAEGHLKFDGAGDLTEQSKVAGPVTSYIWDYNLLYPTAAVTNATSDVIAYTSFEMPTTGSNWITSAITINTTSAFTGRQSANLGSSGRIYKLFTAAPAQLLLSYWASAAATVKINGSTTVTVTTTGATVNGWTYYEYLLPTGTIQVDITSATSIKIDELRLYPKDAQMQTQTYDPLVGITSQVSAAGVPLYYVYDGLQRLTTIKDVNGNIKQNFGYNYGAGIAATAAPQTLFYNTAQTQSFTKQGCPAGSTPTAVSYSVPYGKYAAATQAAADAQATQEITANGQNNANTYGQCLFYNDTPYSKRYFKNDCPPDAGLGMPIVYTVAVGTVSSTISIADANTKAQDKVNNDGQAWANANGTCSCGAEGQKVVNGTCETGTKIYTSSSPSGGQYICVYHYVFSDQSVSQDYTIISPSNCVNN